jgi:hypothetical protein
MKFTSEFTRSGHPWFRIKVKQPTQNYQEKIEETAANKQTNKQTKIAGNFAKLFLCRKS